MLLLLKDKQVIKRVQTVQTLFMCLFAATLCFKSAYNHAFLIAALVFSALLFDPQLLAKNKWPIAALSLIYLVAVLSGFYSSNRPETLRVLERQMTLGFVPLILGSSLPLSHKQLRLIIWSFTLAIAAVCAYLLFNFYFNYQAVKEIIPFHEFLNTRLHHQFSASLGLHATYLSMYVCFAFAGALFILFHEGTAAKITALVLMPLFLFSLILLSSRIIFIPFAGIVFLVMPFFLRKKQFFFYIVSLLIGLSVLFYYVSTFSAFKERFKNDTLRELNLKQDKKNVLRFESITGSNDATRAERWACALELIKERPWLGYGTGDEKSRLFEKYEKYKLTNSQLNNFDAHNQYFAFMIKSGIPGLAAFLILLLFSGWSAIKKRSFHHLCLLFIIAISALTENVLESNKGILFFAFFNALLVFSENGISDKRIPEK